MTFLPIVERELRVRARLKSTYRFRLMAAIGAILLMALLLMMSETLVAAGKYGSKLFSVLSWIAFTYCLLEGTRATADCLSEEKRSGTLGLLFLTDLRPYDVVLGKLMATSLNSFYGLLAIFPPLAIPLVIGGVTVGEFWRMVLLLMNTLFFSLAVGMAVSAASRDGRKAWSVTACILVFLAALPPWLNTRPAWNSSWLAALSPVTGLLGVFDQAYSTAPHGYWRAMQCVHLLGWFSLIAATWILPRSWQDQPLTGTGFRQRLLRRTVRPEGGHDGFERRSLLLDSNPVVWLVTRGAREQAWTWALIGITGGIALTVWFLTSGVKPVALIILATMFLVHFTLSVWVASEACHLFADARNSGAFELLLSTPLAVRDIVEGHVMGLRRQYYRPVVALLTLEGMLLAAYLYVSKDTLFESLFSVLGIGLCLLGAVMDLVAVTRFGLWQGLVNQKASKAVTKTVLYVLILPLAGLCIWPILTVIKNLIFINYAKEQMRRQFRALLAGRYGWAEESEFIGQPSERARANPLPRILPR